MKIVIPDDCQDCVRTLDAFDNLLAFLDGRPVKNLAG